MNKNISYLIFKSFKISVNEIDNCILLYDKYIVFISDIFLKNGELVIRAQRQRFLNSKSLFSVPCTSERLDIFIV